jgi:predicted dehydrogenase
MVASAAMKRLRTAVIGTGFIGRVHVEGVRRLGVAEVCSIGGRRPEAVRSTADALGIEKAETDYRRIVDDPSIDVIHICTPNAMHFEIAKAAMESGKHVLCEKPLTTSSQDAKVLVETARARNRRNCTCHNLRYYPMVQHMRRMREDGDLGEILVVQGTYSQDWLLYDTDWNWRIDTKENGPLRALADIGSHWCDMAEHITGQRITSLCADLQTFHKTRKRPKGPIETFAGKTLSPEDYVATPIDTEDFGSVLIQMGARTRGVFTASQVSAGRKNRLNIEIYGSKSSVAWDQERPDELWIGNRNTNNQIIVKDPSLMKERARSYADLPGGHSEGYADTFKQVFRRFYRSIHEPDAEPEYPQFSDGLRQMKILETELASHQRRAWAEVPA